MVSLHHLLVSTIAIVQEFRSRPRINAIPVEKIAHPVSSQTSKKDIKRASQQIKWCITRSYVIKHVRDEAQENEQLQAIAGANLKGFLGNFALAVPFFDKFILLDGHIGGKPARAASGEERRRTKQRRTIQGELLNALNDDF
jgi:hypothetical protein